MITGREFETHRIHGFLWFFELTQFEGYWIGKGFLGGKLMCTTDRMIDIGIAKLYLFGKAVEISNYMK